MRVKEPTFEILDDKGATIRVPRQEAVDRGWPCRYEWGEMIPVSIERWRETRIENQGPTSYAGARRATAGYRLSLEEKRKIEIQTGQKFEDYGQYKAWCKATGKRDIEKGEPADVHRRDLDEWAKDTGGQGPMPEQFDWKAMQRKNRKPIPTPWREQG